LNAETSCDVRGRPLFIRQVISVLRSAARVDQTVAQAPNQAASRFAKH